MKNRRHFFAMCFLSVVTFILYYRCVSAPFVYDDTDLIVRNPYVKDFSNLRFLFTKDYHLYFGEMTYRPLTTLSFFVDYRLRGLNAAGFHFTNVLLHVLCTLLMYVLVFQATANFFLSLLAALLFGVHPVHAQPVCVVTFRHDLLATAFFLCSLIFCLKSASAPRSMTNVYGAFSFFSFALAMFSKESAVIFVPAAVLCNVTFVTKELRREIRDRKYFYAGCMLFLIVYLYVLKNILFNLIPINSHAQNVDYSFHAVIMRGLTMSRVFAYYLKNLFFPVELYAEYEIPAAETFFEPSIVAALTILFWLLYLAVKLYANHKTLSFGILYYFIALAPVSSIVPVLHFMNDRFLYLPSAGFCLAAAYAVMEICGNKKTACAVVSSCVVLYYSVLTVQQTKIWQDERSVWSHVLEKFPDSENAHFQLGNIDAQRGRDAEALRHLKKALQINPEDARVYNNRGALYFKNGFLDSAMADFTKVIALNPSYTGAYNNRGIIYYRKGLLDAAIAEFTKALKLSPGYADAFYNRGIAYRLKGKPDKALIDFNHALQINPRDAEVYNERGMVYIEMHASDRAKRDFEMSAGLGSADALENIKRYFKSGKPGDGK